jgi:Outer membrane protein beta-barrel domain
MNRARLLVFTVFTTLFFLSAAQLTAGDVAYVHCRAGEAYVYLYQSTGNFQVVANLKCDQQIEITDSQNSAWVRVRTADGKEGYLPQASVVATLPRSPQQSAAPQSAAPQSAAPQPAAPQAAAPQAAAPQAAAPQAIEPPPPPKAAPVGPAPAASVGVSLSRLDESDTPRVEVSGGYSFLNADTNGLSTSRQNLNGFDSSFTFNGTTRLGAEMDFSAYFLSPSENLINLGAGPVDLQQRQYDILGGGRYNARKFFVHALVGMDRMSLVPLGTRVAEDSLALAAGVGTEWKFSRHFALKASGDWIYTRHDLYNLVTPGFPPYMQNSIRISVGIAYRAGSVPDYQ